MKGFILKKIFCTKETEAEITGYNEERSFSSNDNSTTYQYKYRYYVSGNCVDDISDIGEPYKMFKVGSKVVVKYNPTNYKQHYIPESNYFSTMVLGGIFFMSLGTFFFVFTSISIW